MASSVEEQAVHYTDGVYATRFALRRLLGTSLIDYQWNFILKYRDAHRAKLSLKTLANHNFLFTKTKAIEDKLSGFGDSLSDFCSSVRDLCSDEDMKTQWYRSSLLPLLTEVARYEGKDVSELTLKAMLNGMYREDNPEHTAILGYKKALDELMNDPPYEANEEYLARIYAYLCGGEPETLYRDLDHGSKYTTMNLDGDFKECPASEIEAMMANLWSFLRYEQLDPMVKAFTGLYAIHYLKPFPAHNEAMAVLFCKTLLASSIYGGEIAYLPLEGILEDSQELREVLGEISSSDDLTYFYFRCVSFLRPKLEEELDEIAEIRTTSLKEEMVELTPSDLPSASTPIIEEPQPELVPENPAEAKPIEEEVAVQPALKETPRKVEAKPVPAQVILPKASGGVTDYAIRVPKASLSEKEIREAARYILETNPNIRKAQALFYASHCALGSYYSIQDFKKSARCAYETARTSMDNLAREGFYEKLQVKNKFVYTPLKQGEKK